IWQGTRVCRDTRAANQERSFETMASLYSPIRGRISRVTNLSMCLLYDSMRGNCGVVTETRAMRFIWTYGRITLSRLDDLPRLPRDADGPVFAEPWQAQAVALAVKLSEQGHFTWREWAAALAAELQAAEPRGEPDDGSRYYEYWLAALERLVQEKGLMDSASLVERKEAWADAYRH